MDTYKVHAGSLVNLETVFDNVQNYTNGNFFKRLSKLTKSYGNIDSSMAATILDSSTISISSGTCLFPNGEIATIPVSSVSTDTYEFAPGAKYCIIIKYKSLPSESVNSANGFYFNGAGSTMRYSKYLDSYEFLIKAHDYTTLTDELKLCKFTALSDKLIDEEIALEDARTDYYIKDTVIDSDVFLRVDQDYTIAQNWVLSKLTTPILSLNNKFNFTASGNDIILKPVSTDGYVLIKDVNDLTLYSLNTNTGDVVQTIDTDVNPNAKFIFNGNIQVNGNILVGNQEVALQDLSDALPINPVKFRITDIKTTRGGGPSKPFRVTDKVKVLLEWNYNNVFGSGLASGYFDITYIYGESYVANELNGLYFYIPSLNKNYLITATDATANSKTRIRVKDVDTDTYPDLSSVTISAISSKAMINSNAKEYRVVAVVIENGVPVSSIVGFADDIIPGELVAQTLELELEPGITYSFRLVTTGHNFKRNLVDMQPGSFFKYSVPQYYTNPFLLLHPSIPTDGSGLTVSTKVRSLSITVTGFNEADYFEYTVGNAMTGTLTSRTFTIPELEEPGNVAVSVRPYIGTQPVSLPLNTTITVGGTSSAVADVPLFTIPIMHNTISGTINRVSDTEAVISVMRSPALSALGINYPYSSLVGDILRVETDTGTNVYLEYIINNAVPSATAGSYVLTYSKASGTTEYFTAGPKDFFIGTGSKRSRLVANHPVNSKLEITKVAFDLDSIFLLPGAKSGNDHVSVRVFPSNKDTASDVRTLKIKDGVDDITVLDLANNPLIVNGSVSNVKLSIDLYDEFDSGFSNVNRHGLFGTLFIYGKYSSVSSTTGNIINSTSNNSSV